MLVEPYDVAQAGKANDDVAQAGKANYDVNKANHDVPQCKHRQGNELRFSKSSQAAGRMR